MQPQRDALWRFVRSMVRDRHVAEDLMSDTILHAYERFPSLRDEAAFPAFLLTIAHRTITRYRWRRRFTGAYDEEAEAQRAHPDPLPDALADASLLRDALQKLPPAQREAVVLADVLDLPYEEIRAIQGGTLSGVKTRVRRGRAALVRMLTDASDAPPGVHDVPPLFQSPVL